MTRSALRSSAAFQAVQIRLSMLKPFYLVI
jgi:integration host factor subunit beta